MGATVAVAVGLLVLFASPAFAHVTIDPAEALKGSFTKLTFRVPNEMELANTVKFDVKFDENHPIAEVSVKPKPGWTVTVSKKPLRVPLQTATGEITSAVSQIVWSGGAIAPGQFDEFEVSAGPLPSGVNLLLFPAVQTYNDGTEVSWIQQAFSGQPEPDRPAPQLRLTAASGPAAPKPSTGDTSTLALAAFVIGSAGLGFGGWAWLNVRRWR
jgi:uncharacterized protein YcnI